MIKTSSFKLAAQSKGKHIMLVTCCAFFSFNTPRATAKVQHVTSIINSTVAMATVRAGAKQYDDKAQEESKRR
jgi:hypothetical protein